MPTESESRKAQIEIKRQRRLGWRSYTLLCITVIILGALVAYGIWHSQSAAQLSREIEAIRQRDEPITLADLAVGATGEGKQAFSILKRAERSYSEIDERTGLSDELSKLSWNDDEQFDAYWSPEYTAAAERFLREQEPTLKLAYQALANPQVDFPLVQFDGVGNTSFDGLTAYLFGADIPLRRKLHVAGFRGRTAEFIDTFEALFRLAESIEHHPDYHILWARDGTLIGCVTILAKSLPRLQLTDEQFQRLDQAIQRAEQQTRMLPAVWGERVRRSAFFAKLASGEQQVEDEYGDRFSWRETWMLRVEPQLLECHAMSLRYHAEVADLIDTPGPQATESLIALRREIDALPDKHTFLGIDIAHWEFVRREGLLTRQQLINARIALRIDRSFREKREFPEALRDAVDANMQEIPLGLFTGSAAVYTYDDGHFEIGDNNHQAKLRVDYAAEQPR